MAQNEVFENYYFIFSKRLLMIMFIWPYQSRSLKFYGRMTIIVLVHTMMIPQMIKFYEEWYEENRKLEILVENFTGFLFFQGVLSKLYMSIYTEKKLQYLYERVTKDYQEIQEPGERVAMTSFWSFSRLLGIIYASYMLIALFFFVFTPSVVPAIFDLVAPLNDSRPKAICYYAEYFVDQQKYLVPLMIQTFIVVAINLFIVCAVDISFISVAYHGLGLFNLLIFRLKQLCDIADNHQHESLHNFVIDTIKIHTKALHFADVVRVTYDKCFFLVTGLIIMALGVGTIDVMINLTNPEVILRIGFVWVGLVGYMFFTNWPGQRYLDSSDDLLDTIYSCNWHKLPVKTQFLVRFMMMRCLIPCELTAGPLLQMNFANCGAVLRTAMSYFTAMASFS